MEKIHSENDHDAELLEELKEDQIVPSSHSLNPKVEKGEFNKYPLLANDDGAIVEHPKLPSPEWKDPNSDNVHLIDPKGQDPNYYLEEGSIAPPDIYNRKSIVSSNVRSPKLYDCPVCGKGYAKKGNLERHKERHASTSETTYYECKTCGVKLSRKWNLKTHDKIHKNIKDFQCAYCGRTFVQKGCLDQHEKVHKGVKPFECDICGRRFSHKGNLHIHKARHTSNGKFRCELCDCRFISQASKSRHQASQHRGGNINVESSSEEKMKENNYNYDVNVQLRAGPN